MPPHGWKIRAAYGVRCSRIEPYTKTRSYLSHVTDPARDTNARGVSLLCKGVRQPGPVPVDGDTVARNGTNKAMKDVIVFSTVDNTLVVVSKGAKITATASPFLQ